MERLAREAVHGAAVADGLLPKVGDQGQQLVVLPRVLADSGEAGFDHVPSAVVVALAVPLEGVALRSGGVEHGHQPIDGSVSGRRVALLLAGPGEAQRGARVAERAVLVQGADGHVAGLPRFTFGEAHPQDGLERLAALERADRHAPQGALLPAGEVVERLDDGARAGVDHEDRLAHGRGERLAHLARDEVGDLHGRLDELEVAAAGVGHAAQHLLVEVGADAEGRGDDVPVAPAGALADDLHEVGHARVREAVGQEQAAADGVLRQVLGDLLAASLPAAVQVGVAARGDPLDGRDRGVAGLGFR